MTGRDLIELLFTSQYVENAGRSSPSPCTFWPFGIVVLDPVTRAHSERYVLLGVRLAIFGVLVLVLWQYSAALGLVGIISTVILANIAGWCVAASRMARLLHAQRRDLALFGDVGRIALVAGAAALVTVVAHQLVQPTAAWRVLLDVQRGPTRSSTSSASCSLV